MPQYKITFVFNTCRYGWSETWYWQGADFASVKNKTLLLASARWKILGQGAVLEAARISDVATPRICGLIQIPAGVPNENPTDTPWNGILANVCAQDLYHRSIIFRGVPDDWIAFQPNLCNWGPTNVGKDAINNFASSLKTNGFQLRVVEKSAGNLTGHDVTAIAASDKGMTNVTAAGVGGVKGENLKLKDFKGDDKRIINGSHKILKVAGDVYTIQLRFLDMDNPAGLTLGQAFRQSITYIGVDKLEPLRPAKKSTGRAFFVSRGRQPNRR